jgi:MFS family permease
LRYQTIVVVILSVLVGVCSLEQTAFFFLMPFIQPELRLTNTQVGWIAQAYWVACGVSSYFLGALADSTKRWRALTVMVTVGLGLFSGGAALVTSFLPLLGARALMGLVEGPVQPLAQSITALESSPERAAINMGIVGNLGGNILGLAAAPLVLVSVANHFGWRAGFLVCALPSLACAALIAYFIREPVVVVEKEGNRERVSATRGVLEILKYRNVWICMVLSLLFVSFTSIGYQFLPLFIVQGRHMSTAQMGWLMSLVGVSAVVFSLLIPIAADRIGRKAVMIVVSLSAVICPLAVAYFPGSIARLGILVFVGSGLPGALSVFTGTIPAETVPARYVSTAMGAIFGVGIVLGGVLSPVMAGWSADHWGLRTGVLLQAACALAMALVSIGLRETRPSMRASGTVSAEAHR